VKKNRVLITGIAGFAGSFLSELLLEQGFDVYGLLAPRERKDNIKHIEKKLKLERFDILKKDKVSDLVKKTKPAYIFHLAAFSSVGKSFSHERLTYNINFFGTLNLYEAAVELERHLKKLVFISSADTYGSFNPSGKTLNEQQPFNPVSPYGISKVAAEYLTCFHWRINRLPAVVVRAFNHTGPRHAETFVVPSFSKQIAMIEKGIAKPVIKVGDLSAKRDLSDVRDIVRGYYLAALKGKPGTAYQLCSGKSVAIKTVLDKLLGYSETDIKIKIDKNRFRKSDIPVLRGDCSRARKQLGWKTEYNLDKTLKDTLQFWRNKIAG